MTSTCTGQVIAAAVLWSDDIRIVFGSVLTHVHTNLDRVGVPIQAFNLFNLYCSVCVCYADTRELRKAYLGQHVTSGAIFKGDKSISVWNQTEAWGRRGEGGHSILFNKQNPTLTPVLKSHYRKRKLSLSKYTEKNKHHCSFDSIVLSRLHLARR